MSETGYVYTLVDPRTDEPKYVGATQNPKKRYSVLLANPHNEDLSAWINDLKDNGLKPQMQIVRVKPIDEVSDAERKIIADLSARNELHNVKMNSDYDACTNDGVNKIRVETYLELDTVAQLENDFDDSKSAVIRKAVDELITAKDANKPTYTES